MREHSIVIYKETNRDILDRSTLHIMKWTEIYDTYRSKINRKDKYGKRKMVKIVQEACSHRKDTSVYGTICLFRESGGDLTTNFASYIRKWLERCIRIDRGTEILRI